MGDPFALATNMSMPTRNATYIAGFATIIATVISTALRAAGRAAGATIPANDSGASATTI